MHVAEERIDGNRLWILSVVIAVASSLLEIARPELGPLIALYLIAAILGLGLPSRRFRLLICLIVVAMTAPLMFEGPQLVSDQFNAVVQRLAGLCCLGLIVVALDRRSANSVTKHQEETKVGEVDAKPWFGGLLGVQPLSEWVDIGLQAGDLPEGASRDLGNKGAVSGPATSNLTHLRNGDESDAEDDDDFELANDDKTSHANAEPIIHRLRLTGKFSAEQLSIVGHELEQSLGRSLGLSTVRPLEPGCQIGRFIVEEPLGRGGEGHVYRGRDLSGEQAAIKILHNLRVSDRFRREMHLVRQLAHPNIVTAYEVGEFHGLPFITMEYLQGPDLNVRVRDSGPLSWEESTRYVLQAARALGHAHRRDLIHRDVKPGNLILNGEGTVKLVDLGLASMGGPDQLADSVAELKTEDGHLAGTLPYMAPEQARSLARATVQSDVYGLGAAWFYLLTGQERLRGDTFHKQLQNLLLRRRFRPLPDDLLPEPLRHVYRRMVAYDVRDRYANCDLLAEDLERAMTDAGLQVAAVEGINVLVVEDSRTDMVLTIEMLRRSNSTLSIHQARTLADGASVCGRMEINLVLLDLSLPDSIGVETVVRFREAVPDVPLVVLTGMTHDEVGAQCLTAGANSFISKAGLTPHRMERTIFVTLSRCANSAKPPGDEANG